MRRIDWSGGPRFLALALALAGPGCSGAARGGAVSAGDLVKRQTALAASDRLIVPGERIGPRSPESWAAPTTRSTTRRGAGPPGPSAT
jgi:hypothetical protein